MKRSNSTLCSCYYMPTESLTFSGVLLYQGVRAARVRPCYSEVPGSSPAPAASRSCFSVAPSSNPLPRLQVASWSTSYQLGFLTMLCSNEYWFVIKLIISFSSESSNTTAYVSISLGIVAGLALVFGFLVYFFRPTKPDFPLPSGLYYLHLRSVS